MGDFGTDMEAFRSHPLMQDELFGPLLPCVRYDSLEDAVQFIRRLPTGKPLACYCFTRDSEVREQVTTRTTSGGMCINDAIMHLANSELPFGGVGESGMGSYHGHRSFAVLTHEKAALRKYAFVDKLPGLAQLLDARFPAYSGFKKFAVNMFGKRSMMKTVNVLNPAMPMKALWRFLIQLFCAWVVLRLTGRKVAIKKMNHASKFTT